MDESQTYTFRRVTSCSMCGSTRFNLLGARLNASQGKRPRQAEGVSVSVKQCRDCDLIFADPMPIPADFADHYGIPPDQYWTSEHAQGYFTAEIAAAKRLIGFREGMTALDIGAGQGEGMAALADAGFDTSGIEPSEPFYRSALRRVDPHRLQLARIEDAHFPDASFDFITFGAVLEHLFNPGQAIRQAMKWLKPGGVIHAEVPNARHLEASIISRYFRLWGTTYVSHISPMHPPFHLYEFTLRSFRRFTVVEHKHLVCELVSLPKIIHPLLKWWMSRTSTGMQLVVYLSR